MENLEQVSLNFDLLVFLWYREASFSDKNPFVFFELSPDFSSRNDGYEHLASLLRTLCSQKMYS